MFSDSSSLRKFRSYRPKKYNRNGYDISYRLKSISLKSTSNSDSSESSILPDVKKQKNAEGKRDSLRKYARARSTPRKRNMGSCFDLPDVESPRNKPPSRERRLPRKSSSVRLKKLDYNTETSSSDKGKLGVVGLRNLGNTCYMNSSLQCLSNISVLRDWFVSGDFKDDLNRKNGRVTKAFAKVLKKLWNRESISSRFGVSPSTFKQCVDRTSCIFRGYFQHDSAEFTKYLIDQLHEGTNRVTVKPKYKEVVDIEGESDIDHSNRFWSSFTGRNQSKIVDLFAGQLKSRLKCLKCGNVSRSFDPFFEISLPIPLSSKSKSRFYYLSDDKCYYLTDCFKKFTEEEKLLGREKPYCSKCKKHQMSSKQISIFRLPKVLLVVIKRFNNRNRKLVNEINFPVNNFDISDFVDMQSKESKTKYNLVGVVNHIGSVYGGHYTAFAKNVSVGKWVSYNDSRVRIVSSRTVQSSSAYALFYIREDVLQ